MGRQRQNFSLYPRKVCGKTIWYYRTYSPRGERTTGKSTGCTSRVKASLFCEELIRRNKLYSGTNLTFEMYTSGWFEEGSDWLEEKKKIAGKDKPFSENTLKSYKNNFERWILPFFKDMPLNKITPEIIRKFRDNLIKNDLSSNSISVIMYVLRMIITAAYKEQKILNNPSSQVASPSIKAHSHDSFSVEECKRIISNTTGMMRNMCIIAALTGMRCGEIQGLDRTEIKDGYIDLTHQLQNGKNTSLKAKYARKVPICKSLSKMLFSLCEGKSDTDYLIKTFPSLSHCFKKILYASDIPDIQERNLTFHSWRHFFNTYMASNKVDARIIAAVSGHSTGITAVQSIYINFKVEDYADIIKEQEKLFEIICS